MKPHADENRPSGRTDPLPAAEANGRNRRFSFTQPSQLERLFLPDSVEEVGFRVIAAGGRARCGRVDEAAAASCHGDDRRPGDQLGELAEVLGSGGEVELVAGSAWPA